MLDELRRITSMKPYRIHGGMLVRETIVVPRRNQATLTLELFEDDEPDTPRQLWEIVCNGLGLDSHRHFPDFLIPTCQIKVLDNHPLLWNYADEIFFSIKGRTTEISSLIGDLYIEHEKTSGNWIDFHWIFSGLAKALITGRENQFSIPAPLKDACFTVLRKYGVPYSENHIQEGDTGYNLLLFSKPDTWPDEENFGQPYIIAKNFTERRVA